MSANSPIVLLDAEAVIELFRLGLEEKLFHRSPEFSFQLAMAASAKEEVHFFRDNIGKKVPIFFEPWITGGGIQIFSADAVALERFVSLERKKLGIGELESLALVLDKGYSFCTGDEAAIRWMRSRKLEKHWLALEEVLQERNLHSNELHPRHTRAFWKKKFDDR